MKTIGERIKNKRKELGLTQAELAQKLNVTDRAVSKWEVDEGNPDFSILPNLADVLGVTLDYLIKGKEPEKEEIVMSRMEYVCKTHDVEGFKKLNIRKPKETDEAGHNIYEYIEKYNASEILNEINPGILSNNLHNLYAEIDPFFVLCIKFDNLKALENNGFFTFHNDLSLIYIDQYVKYMVKEGYKAKKITNKYFSAHKERFNPEKSKYVLNANLNCITPYKTAAYEVIKTENKDAIAAVIPHIIEFNKNELLISKRSDNYVQYKDWFSRDYVNNTYYHVYLNKEEITALLKLGFIEEAKYFNSIAKKEDKVEDNQVEKYTIIKSGNKKKADTRLYDVMSGKIVIIDRLEKINDPQFIIDTLKNYPVCYEEYVLDLAKKGKNKELFEFYVDNGLNTRWAISSERIEDELDDFIKRLYRKEGVAYSKLNDINRLNDIRLGSNRDYAFHEIMERNIGRVGTCGECKGSILPFTKMVIYGENTYKNIHGYVSIKQIKQDIINKNEAKINALKMVRDNYNKEYFLKELDKGNVENVVIKLCTLLEVKLKAMGKLGDLLEMLKSYCSKFYYTYDDGWNGEVGISDDDKHTEDILQRLRIMRNNFLHAEVKEFEPLSSEELIECVNYICDEMEVK